MSDSDYRDPTTWRLRTPGGIPYRIVHYSGGVTNLEADVAGIFLIPANQLAALMEEVFPRPAVQRNASTGEKRLLVKNPPSFPGFPGIRAQAIKWRPHIDGLPVDPFGVDSAAPPGTYQQVLEVEITFANSSYNPRTLISTSANATGEFISLGTPPGAVWARAPSDPFSDDAGNPLPVTKPNTNPALPLVVELPETAWTLKRVFLPKDWFEEVTLPLLREAMGKVNQGSFAGLSAPAETMLFDGYAYDETYTWRAGENFTFTGDFAGVPYVTLDIHLKEKYLELDSGEIAGHNHLYQPGVGWTRIWMDSARTLPPYILYDFDQFFGREDIDDTGFGGSQAEDGTLES